MHHAAVLLSVPCHPVHCVRYVVQCYRPPCFRVPCWPPCFRVPCCPPAHCFEAVKTLCGRGSLA
jgi:hypothetical protein